LPLVCRIAQRLWLLRVEVALYLGSTLGLGVAIELALNVIGRWASLWGIGNPLGFYGWIREEGCGLRDSS